MSRTDRASRLVDVAPDQVYDALVNADALVRWLPPSGMTADIRQFDPRPGGSFRVALSYVDAGLPGKAIANSDVVQGRFVEVKPGLRVVQAVEFVSDDPSFAGTMTLTWQLAAVDGGTLVEVRADDVPPGISAVDHEVGMTSSLMNLAAFLAHQSR
jgi:uncharacterized protein YndB with AHSA1/START domain